jgi:hypothetical protein
MAIALQVKISGSGILVTGPNFLNRDGFIIKSHTSNTPTVWIQDTGLTYLSGSGFGIAANENMYANVSNLNMIDFYVESGSAVIFASKA